SAGSSSGGSGMSSSTSSAPSPFSTPFSATASAACVVPSASSAPRPPRRRRPERRRRPFGKFRSSSRARAEGLRALRVRAPRNPPQPPLARTTPPDVALGERLQQHLDALAALVARPAADDVDRLVEGLGVAHQGDLLQRADAQLRVAVALQAGDHEPPPQLA